MSESNGIPPHLRRNESSGEPHPQDVPLALSLSQNQFVGNASDRQHEAGQYTGSNYVAISNVCRFASRAEVEIFDDRLDQSQRKSYVDGSRRRRRKSLLNAHGPKWKSFVADASVAQQADPEFRWWKLAEQPNPWQTGSHLRYTAIMQMRLHGIAFVWNVKNKFGKTIWRIPVPLALCSPIAPGSREHMPFGGVTVHSFGWMLNRFAGLAVGNRSMQYIASREISLDDLTVYAYPHPAIPGDGASPTTAIDAWIQLASKATQAQSDQFDRGPDKKVMVHPPADAMVDTAALKSYQRSLDKQIRETTTGVVVAASGGTHDLTVSPDEMGYDQEFNKAILMAHGVPGAATGDSDGMTYGSVAAVLTAYGTLNVQADLDTLADEDTLQMRSEEGSAFSLAYICPPFDDPELAETKLTNDLTSGSITTDEYRIGRGLKPFGGPRGQLAAGSQAAIEWDPKTGTPGSPAPTPGMPQVGNPESGSLSNRVQTMLGSRQKSMISSRAPDERPYVIAVDLDGTLTIDAEYDEERIPEPRMGMVEAVRAMKTAGCGIIIYTVRDNDLVVSRWLETHSIPFDAINADPWPVSNSGKPMADIYLDNRAVNAEGSEASVMAAVIDQVDSDDVRAALRDSIKRRHFTRLYGFLFAPVENEALRVVDEARSMIRRDHLAAEGIEQEPHITLLHQVAEKPWDVTDQLRAAGKFQYEIGELVAFRNGDNKATIVVRVFGKTLDDLRRLCTGAISHVQSAHDWNPHITIATVQERFADEYDGKQLSLTGKIVEARKLVYRPAGEADLVIPLR